MPSSPSGLDGSSEPRAASGALAFVAAGLIGAAFGLRYATWQWAVELAQITAGIVPYDPTAPASVLHWHLWSLVDQLTALLLRFGVGERALSWLLSAVAGAASAQALAMITFALTHRTAPALLVPLVLLSLDLTAYGPSYPLMLVGLPHTYGMLGLSLAMLSLGLVGSGWWRFGALLSGLAIAVQPTTGLPVAAFLLAACYWQPQPVTSQVRWSFSAGVGLSAASCAVFLSTRGTISHIDGETAHRFLTAFVAFWDLHRFPLDWRHRGVAIDLLLLVLTAMWLRFRPRRAEHPADSARLMLTTLAVAAAAGPLLAALSWIQSALPDIVVAAMPARLLNVAVFAAGPVGASALFCWLQALDARRAGFRRSVVPLTWGLVSIVVPLALMFPSRRLLAEPMSLRATEDPVWAAATARPGVLLTGGGIWLAQLRTRRPVLLEGATLDTLPYALDAGPQVERILRGVYGQSLLTPPPNLRPHGGLSVTVNRRTWEAFGPADWQKVRTTFGVFDVIAPSDWSLRLPVVAASPSLRMYAIPQNGIGRNPG